MVNKQNNFNMKVPSEKLSGESVLCLPDLTICLPSTNLGIIMQEQGICWFQKIDNENYNKKISLQLQSKLGWVG